MTNIPEKLYLITAVNRLTGEREPITGKHGLVKIQEMLYRMRTMPKHTKFRPRAYKYPKIEEWHPQEGQLTFAG